LPSTSIIFRLEGSPAKPFGDGTNALREIRAQDADAPVTICRVCHETGPVSVAVNAFDRSVRDIGDVGVPFQEMGRLGPRIESWYNGS